MDKKSLKNSLIFISFSLGVLLPVRLVFSEFVSDYWLGNLGVITATGAVLLLLARKNKLGRLGQIFEKEIMKTVKGRTGKYVLVASIMFLIYFGSTLALIERGNTVYVEDKKVFYNMITEQNLKTSDVSQKVIQGPLSSLDADSSFLNLFFVLEYAFSITYAMLDDMSEGWVSHLYAVLFVEQIEIIALLLWYRTNSPVTKLLKNLK